MGARIFNIQKYSIYDGPGIRTLVFFKGCPLRCLWCSNPEGKKSGCSILWNRALCSHCGLCARVCPNGLHAMQEGQRRTRAGQCAGCGKCQEACPQRALKICGQIMETSELLRVIQEDMAFYETSGGGATLGGGEPLAQPDAAIDLLRACVQAGIHTAMETCGDAPLETVMEAAPYVNLFLYDIKHMDSEVHASLTGRDNARILGNLAWLLDNGHNVRARMPLVHGCNATAEEMERRAVFLERWKTRSNFCGVDLLPYHKLGLHKYEQLGENYTLGDNAVIADAFLRDAVAIFANHGLRAAVVKH